MASPSPARFTITRRRPGYSIPEVDDFVAQIEQALADGAQRAGTVTADDVRTVRFSTVRLKPGYDEREVDAALDLYVAELSQRQA
jgi:DivIVA domain-containing protein